jgi:O-antigen ligase
MAVPQPGGSSAAPKDLAPRGKLGGMPPGGWLAAASLVVTDAVLAIQWPTAAVLFGLLLVVLVLCVRVPVYAFALALVLFSFEGTIKMRLSVEGAPSPVALGAACLDFAFLASLTALLVHDRGRALVRVWERATRLERVAAALLAAWLMLSVLQIPLGGDLVNGLEGFRLTHLYVPALLGGVIVASQVPEQRLAPLLLGVVALAVTYAGVRGITGPSVNEQVFAAQRGLNTTFGDLGRNTGSFTGPLGLVSFLVPAGLFCLVLSFLRAERRWISGLLFLLAMTGIIASFVRTTLVAVAAGAVLMAVLVLWNKGSRRRLGAYAVALVVLVSGGEYAATLIASEVTPSTEWRAAGLARPFADYSVTTRFDRWQHTLETVTDEPLGTGIGTLGRATVEGRRGKYTDNSYLKILQEQGPLGGLLFLGGLGGILLGTAIRLVRLDPSRRPIGTAALAGVVGFLVLMVMAEYIEQPGKVLAWTLLGVAVWQGSVAGQADDVLANRDHDPDRTEGG